MHSCWTCLDILLGSVDRLAATGSLLWVLRCFRHGVTTAEPTRWNRPLRMGSVRALHGLHGRHGLGSSFYVDCDAFNNAVTASRRGSETFLEAEGQKLRLNLLRQLDNSPDKVGAGEPYQSLRMVDLNHAAKWCADDPKCTGLCFSSENGWARYYHHPIQEYTADAGGAKGWVCLSLKGVGPAGTGMRAEMRPCFRSLEEVSGGAWLPSKVPKDELWLPDGSILPLRVHPTSSNMGHEAQMNAEALALFAAAFSVERASSSRKPRELGAFL